MSNAEDEMPSLAQRLEALESATVTGFRYQRQADAVEYVHIYACRFCTHRASAMGAPQELRALGWYFGPLHDVEAVLACPTCVQVGLEIGNQIVPNLVRDEAGS